MTTLFLFIGVAAVMIQKGDIICVQGSGFIPRGIMWATGMPVHHVAIGLDDNTIWQADVGINVSQGEFNFDHYVLIRRKGLTPEQADKIIEFCEMHRDAPYARVSILGYLLKYKFGWDIIVEQEGAFTCNQLVERAFNHALIELFGPDAVTGNEVPGSYLQLALSEPDNFEIVKSTLR